MAVTEEQQRTVSDPEVMMGKPTVRGTRITVEHILRMSAAGLSVEDLLAEHPNLTKDDIFAAHAFAADYLRDRGADAAE